MSLDEEQPGEGGTDARTGGARPTCTNCGQNEAPAAHTLRFEREDRSDRVVDLQLCEHCLDDIAGEPTVERLESE